MGQNTLRIASYNIRKARGLDQKVRPDRILNVVNSIAADVVVLQEADKRLGVREPAVGRDMISHETDFELVEVSQNQISLGWHGNAILLRKGLNVASFERIDLPALEPRGALRIDLDGFADLSIVATHLGLLRRNRNAQLKAIDNATKDCGHLVIAGDMNEWSKHGGFAPLKERFDVLSPGHSFHAKRPIAALDRFALSKQVTLNDAGVVQTALAKRASDHLPIWCDVSVGDGSADSRHPA